jgi:tetraacyldisaccharide 4'-kinase
VRGATNAILFVTNGHGEAAIAKRIAHDVRQLAGYATHHLALVGTGFGDDVFIDVGPQATLPSGGLVAMGNVRAFAGDVRAGFFGVLVRQWKFLRAARGRYAAVVAVGDVYALLLARAAGRPTVYVGTAKSTYVAPYGPMERRVLRGADAVFVRDEATAEDLRAHGVDAHAPGNVIVDLLASAAGVKLPWHGIHRIAILPGSRPRAYDDASVLVGVVCAVAQRIAGLAAALSIAPGLDPAGFAPALARMPAVVPWPGDLGALLRDATLVVGQAGTANEAAAAHGLPVVALDLGNDRASTWYRMRQARLLGDALLVVPGDAARAADAVVALLGDEDRLAVMRRVGRERMGGAGGAAAIASAVVELVARSAA